MSTSMLLGLFDWVGDFFKSLFDLIPKIIYLLYSSLACVLDVLQLFFRKLAGLDVYYIEGEAVGGDLVTNFIAGIIGIKLDGNDNTDYSALSTVFWAFIIFGVIICFASTLVAVIKSHYSYDDKAAKGPMQYVYAAGKAIINMAAVPIIVVLGLYLSQAVLTAIDSITSIDSSAVVSLYGDSEELDENGKPKSLASDLLDRVSIVQGVTGKSDETTYIYYDIFGFAAGIQYSTNSNPNTWPSIDKKQTVYIGAKNQTFSGSLFKVAAYNANRARLGYFTQSSSSSGSVTFKNFTGSASSDYKLFKNARTTEELAAMIDTAFANALHIKDGKSVKLDYDFSDIASTKYFTNWYASSMASFSKFNVGAVWYYYDLWNFNFIVGFGACMICLSIFINIIIGLITRLFISIGLFLIAPPIFGLAPLDGGGAAKKWREGFLKQVLMTFGAVYGMNIFFLILPFINRISFFNIEIADYFAQTLVIIVGLITIKAFIGTVSGLIGAEDANKSGEGIKEEALGTMGKAVKMTAGAALAPVKLGKGAFKTGMAAKNWLSKVNAEGNARGEAYEEKKAKKEADKFDTYEKQDAFLFKYAGKTAGDVGMDQKSVMNDAIASGMSKKEAKQMWDVIDGEQKRAGAGGKLIEGNMKGKLLNETDGYGRKNKLYDANYAEKYHMKSSGTYAGSKTNAQKNVEDHKILKESYMDKAEKEAKKYEKNKSGLSDIWSASPFHYMHDAFKDDKGYAAFAEKSGAIKKRDYAKETADSTKDIKKQNEKLEGTLTKLNKKLDKIDKKLP